VSKWDAVIDPSSRGLYDQAVMSARDLGEEAIGHDIAQMASDLVLSREGDALVKSLIVSSDAFGKSDDPGAGIEVFDGELCISIQVRITDPDDRPACTNPDHRH
jgi:hypothetical protein